MDTTTTKNTKPTAPKEFVVLIRNSKTGTLHALLNPKRGDGALAVFETPEQAVSQTEGIPLLRNREYFIIPVE